jgi:hypothetical protein
MSATELDTFIEKLRAEHAALMKSYNEGHDAAEAAWAKHEQNASRLTEFRSKYGGYLKLADQGAIAVPALPNT